MEIILQTNEEKYEATAQTAVTRKQQASIFSILQLLVLAQTHTESGTGHQKMTYEGDLWRQTESWGFVVWRRLWGNLTAAFQHKRGAYKKDGEGHFPSDRTVGKDF